MITVDMQRGRFVIVCPVHDVGLVANLPNRRFNKNRGIWTAPPIRLNIINIIKWENTVFSPAAREVLDRYHEKDKQESEPFPENYNFSLEPFPFQKIGLDTVWSIRNSALFMDAGCYSGDTEYLTSTGWERIDEYKGGKIAQFIPGEWTDDGKVEFVDPIEYIKYPCKEMIQIGGKTDQKLSLNHRMLLYYKVHGKKYKTVKLTENWAKLSVNRLMYVPSVFSQNTKGMPYSDQELRLLVAIQADGRYPSKAPNTNRVCVSVKKERKKERMKQLLNGFEYNLTEGEYNDYRFNAPIRSKSFGDEFWWDANEEQRKIIIDEICHWDGCFRKPSRPNRTIKQTFYTNDKKSADFIQWCGASIGRCSTVSEDIREGRNINYCVYIGNKPHSAVKTGNANIIDTDDGFKYCFVVPSSFLIMRRNGRIFASGNTGKTKIAVDTATARYILNKIQKVVVIGLVSIKRNWIKEILKHCPIESASIPLETTKTGQRKLAEFRDFNGLQWLVLGIESFSNGNAYSITKDYIDSDTMLIVDESSRIKNHKAKRTKLAIELGQLNRVKYKMILTGTPLTQGAGDLYSQFEFLDPDIIGIGDHYSFEGRYCVKGGHEGKQVIGYQRLDELTEACNPYIFQVRKREVLPDLPDFTKTVRTVKMTAEQKKLYKELKSTMRIEYKGKKLRVMNVMNMMQRFGEITGGHISYEIDNPNPLTVEKKPKIYQRERLNKAPKLEELMVWLEELAHDEQVVIWAAGKDEVQLIVERLSKVYGAHTVGQIHGGIKPKVYNEYVNQFQEGKLTFMVGNPTVGGIGLDLFSACYMVYYSRDFSLETAIQSEARIDRIGQKRAMTYVDLVCEGTIDEYILNSLSNKEDFADTIRDAFDDGSFIDLV